MPRNWYVLKVKPRSESRVSSVLVSRAIACYLPIVKVKRQKPPADRTEPLFPGYLFVHIDLRSDEWLKTRCAPGVVYTLGSEGEPTPVPNAIIDNVRQRLDACRGVLVPRFTSGDRVQILEGPFEGLEAVFDAQLSGAVRSRVLLSILGRQTRLSISTYSLRRSG